MKTYRINEDHLIAWLAVELLVVFIKSGGIQTLATLLALDALFMEWGSVNCHEGLEKEENKKWIFRILILSMPQLGTQTLSMQDT